ncbi:aromatic ring-hydroxylating oxygenase subunit alpha [Sorangium atrum]|uniref:Aromatic ring-hydroxylating dioxygenase subunit alpha n=1 Tax=Sorangium atrum TaxID=2995308 RepID=A0ABT5CF65_9BACT|nr:aromatic ring-hydroxylating dioxygenase subunit alpha [Sorangium aterium]MDC0685084.1 aromatic ring-hydroxylating dioxygenase subunit alpha [Sorangium aterium]
MSFHYQPLLADHAKPPSFEEARLIRQQARATGLHPDYWYPVARSGAVRPGQVISVRFWGRDIAIFRGEDGRVRALEDRCPHRAVKLSLGNVNANDLVCGYHGWRIGESGRLVGVGHELFGRRLPVCGVDAFPVQERHDLIWIFPGNASNSSSQSIPAIPELECEHPWPCARIDMVFRAHHSILAENINDFTHAYLHRRYNPFVGATIDKCEEIGDKAHISYATLTGQGRFSKYFVDRSRFATDRTDLSYEYPHHFASTRGLIKSWAFVLPIDSRTTQAFFLFYFGAIRLPLLPFQSPRWLTNLIIQSGKNLTIRPILEQDRMAIEAEQCGYERHFAMPALELSPAILLIQRLMIRKWKEYVTGAAAPTESSEETP